MKDIILNQGEQIRHSLKINKDTRVDGQFDGLILCGMGGSGHPGDLLNALNLPKVPLLVHRSYNLPARSFKQPLVIISSYSGNTEESLTAYREARAASWPMLSSSAGGKLQQWSQKDDVPFCLIDFADMQPRHTLFAAFTGIYTALRNSNLVTDITSDLLRVAQVLDKEIPTLEEPAKALAKNLKGKTPLYYSSNTLGFAAKNFKIQTNENAKTPAFWNEFPELNHNEMIGFSLSSVEGHGTNKFHVVMLRDTDDHPRIKARMDVTAELYKQWGIEVSTFEIKGQTPLEKIFYSVCFGLWTTYYLALEYGIDPVPVAGVENFKQRLAELAGEAV